jgi:hypothetical protein
MNFEQFKQLDISDIEKWRHIKLTDEEILRWKQEGCLVEKIYEFKMKRLYLKYLKVELQNIKSQIDPFMNYNPINEAEKILRSVNKS